MFNVKLLAIYSRFRAVFSSGFAFEVKPEHITLLNNQTV
ncbi:hypothetical protein PALI_a3496 [Pseudoalteromonas aliena SW19]|uniref:Uncharacterized protein n=1 Tax=Pseudoalteromonas aliena SW19 TaxID=1314866 RepID=A0ABR9DU26_9GAMM|nr:hypothetical protein [Pseudoalteromonas aliena SW19]